MKARINKYKSANEYFFQENCYINELSNSSDDPDLSIAQARVKPGVTTKAHRLNDTTERYVILQGTGKIHIEGLQDTDVTTGDVVIIPAGHSQQICNTGKDDLVFLALCTPRFNEHNYHAIEGDA